MHSFLSYSNLSSEFRVFTVSINTTTVPKNIHMVMEIPEWKIVVIKEMGAFEKNNTWDLCAFP